MALEKIQEPLGTTSFPPKMYFGTSGWAYPSWKPDFYPADLSIKRFLTHYASRLNSVEVNYTFRAMPTPKVVAEWLASTPAGFRFSFKAPQKISHFSRLLESEAILAGFLDVLDPVRVAGKLGVILFQLPPNFRADVARLQAFLALPMLNHPMRFALAFEFRHESWFQPAVYRLLQKSGVVLCVAETDDFCTPEVHTAPNVACFRLRRNGGYSTDELAAFSTRFRALAATHDVYVYLKHEAEATGALNAEALTSFAAHLTFGRG